MKYGSYGNPDATRGEVLGINPKTDTVTAHRIAMQMEVASLLESGNYGALIASPARSGYVCLCAYDWNETCAYAVEDFPADVQEKARQAVELNRADVVYLAGDAEQEEVPA